MTLTFGPNVAVAGGTLTLNYIDDATKLKAEEIIQTAKSTASSMKIVLGEKVI